MHLDPTPNNNVGPDPAQLSKVLLDPDPKHWLYSDSVSTRGKQAEVKQINIVYIDQIFIEMYKKNYKYKSIHDHSGFFQFTISPRILFRIS